MTRPTGALAPRERYLARLRRSAGIGIALVLGWVVFGAAVYHRCTTSGDVYDAIRHAAMLVAGMGPVAELQSDACKLFDAFYALVSAFGVLAVAGFAFAPWFHRMLHRFHMEDTDGSK